MTPLLFAALAGAALLASPAAAQQGATDDPRINQLILYGEETCPPSTAEEIIVCARLPEDDRFRIPNNLRGNPNDPANQSWVNRASELSYVGRDGIGSCSTVGPGGYTGCYEQILRQARAERGGRDEVNWNRLIEQARQERLAKIETEREEEERRLRGIE